MKMEKELLARKIKMFSQMVDSNDKKFLGKAVEKNSEKNPLKDDVSYIDSKTSSNTGSMRTSGVNSISFSLASNESSFRSKKGTKKNSLHNKSIFV